MSSARLGGSSPDHCLHFALFFGDEDQYARAAQAFIEAGLSANEPVLVVVPRGHLELLRSTLPEAADRVKFVDMLQLGGNPSRIIPAMRDWVSSHGDHGCRIIGEPLWPERHQSQTIEVVCHEALLNLAFAGTDTKVLCPYDQVRLGPDIIHQAKRTHPQLTGDRGTDVSADYEDPLEIWRAAEWPLPEAPAGQAVWPIVDDLAAMRRDVADHIAGLGLTGTRASDFVLCVNEAATNALIHGRPPARLRIWTVDGSVVGEVSDHGHLEDPLAGRRRPQIDDHAGRGLWVINELCDFVELRGDAAGTTIRLHASLS